MKSFATSTAIVVAIIAGFSFVLEYIHRFLNNKASTSKQRDANETIVGVVTLVIGIALIYKFGFPIVFAAIIIEQAISKTVAAYANA